MPLTYLPSPNWAVVYGEVPSATRWSELGLNDNSLATGAGIDSLAILTRHYNTASITEDKIVATGIKTVPIQTKVYMANGKVTDTVNGVNIVVGTTSSLYEVYTLGWAGVTTGKAGYALCSSIASGFQTVEIVKGGAYSGTITFTGGTINIKPYAADGCQYLVLRTCQFL